MCIQHCSTLILHIHSTIVDFFILLPLIFEKRGSLRTALQDAREENREANDDWLRLEQECIELSLESSF